MKKCPTCQNTFNDDKRFCQIDGTPLIDDVEPPPAEDPFKTVVMGSRPAIEDLEDDSIETTVASGESNEDDLLQIPEVFDPMKTMVMSEPRKFEPSVPKVEEPVVPAPEPPKIEEPVVPAPEPPKFSEPNLSPPNFSEMSANEPPKVEPPPVESPVSEPFGAPPKTDSPFSNPFTEPSDVEPARFEAPPLPGSGLGGDSPFGLPKNEPIPSPFDAKEPTASEPFKEPEPAFKVPPSPFESTPFSQPDQGGNQVVQQAEWNPPPAPVQSWQDQSVGQNTPFQPPAVSGGQNQTLPIVSLVFGILSLCCYVGWITGPIALITGYMGRKNAANDPENYGGNGLALAGMIIGGIFTVIWLLYWVFIILVYAGLIGASFLNR